MDAGLLDSLVKLASIGASGICIFAIFWIGWLILQLPPNADPERHKTLRMFMVICVVIAVISAGTGILSAMFNRDMIVRLEREKQAVEVNEKTLQTQVTEYKEQAIKTRKAADALKAVLKSKEAANLENPSNKEIKTHIDLLKTFLAEMDKSAIK
jgi:formate hydrogenlyase subunit 3/multisubunit Na+/H+ antiporter MnhD subunit